MTIQLTPAEQHQLKVARDTLKMNSASSPSVEEAKRIIRLLTGEDK